MEGGFTWGEVGAALSLIGSALGVYRFGFKPYKDKVEAEREAVREWRRDMHARAVLVETFLEEHLPPESKAQLETLRSRLVS